jgi:CHAT domain-containing protein
MTGIAHVQGSAIRARLLDAIARAQIVDVSCHGVFDDSDVLRSRLFLAGSESLLMSEVLGKVAELGGLRLFLLSACQTALVDVYGAADEVHSLTTSMLQAGAEAVLGSLWSVDDQATYLFMARFAQEWFPRMTQEPPAAALARAQRWLRNVTNRELQTWQNVQLRDEAGEQPSPEPRQTAHRDNHRAAYVGVRGRGSRYSMSFAQTLVRQRAQQSDADERPFADPIYWAAFQLSGW